MLKYKINRVFVNYQVLVGFFFFFWRVAKLRTEIIIPLTASLIIPQSQIIIPEEVLKNQQRGLGNKGN
jgi:hypothetical protein